MSRSIPFTHLPNGINIIFQHLLLIYDSVIWSRSEFSPSFTSDPWTNPTCPTFTINRAAGAPWFSLEVSGQPSYSFITVETSWKLPHGCCHWNITDSTPIGWCQWNHQDGFLIGCLASTFVTVCQAPEQEMSVPLWIESYVTSLLRELQEHSALHELEGLMWLNLFTHLSPPLSPFNVLLQPFWSLSFHSTHGPTPKLLDLPFPLPLNNWITSFLFLHMSAQTLPYLWWLYIKRNPLLSFWVSLTCLLAKSL